MNNNLILLTIDVEDWQQSTWDRNLPISQKAAENTNQLLDILEKLGVQATMFVLGKFSEKYPEIIRKMHRSGHEVACHGYGHVEIFKQDYKKFKSDVQKSKDKLEQIIGESVIGYRAPDFSIINSSTWALEVLSELGFQYDSSIYPIHHKRYGIPNWPTNIHNIILNNGLSIVECPLSVYKIGNLNIPVSGGGYFRFIPIKLFLFFTKQVLKKRPFIFYMHPYELNHKEFNELEFQVPFFTRIHQGFGRKYFLGKLKILLNKFETTTFRDLINNKLISFPSLDISILK